MKLTDSIKRPIWNCFFLFSIIVIFLTLFRQVFLPDSYFALIDMIFYMIYALAASLVIRFIQWLEDRNSAHGINMKLKAMKEEPENEAEDEPENEAEEEPENEAKDEPED